MAGQYFSNDELTARRYKRDFEAQEKRIANILALGFQWGAAASILEQSSHLLDVANSSVASPIPAGVGYLDVKATQALAAEVLDRIETYKRPVHDSEFAFLVFLADISLPTEPIERTCDPAKEFAKMELV